MTEESDRLVLLYSDAIYVCTGEETFTFFQVIFGLHEDIPRESISRETRSDHLTVDRDLSSICERGLRMQPDDHQTDNKSKCRVENDTSRDDVA